MSAERQARRAAKPKGWPHRHRHCATCVTALPASDHVDCDSERLCDLIDVSLLATRPGLATTQYAELGALIAAGQDSVPSAFAARIEAVRCGEDFVRLVEDIHRHLFEGVFDFAGSLRASGQEACVDENHHTVQGVMGGPQVRVALLRLFESVGLLHTNLPLDVPAFAAWFARFLQRFFAVHPFPDGNGRTARSIVDLVARSTPNIVLVVSPAALRGSGRARRSYIKALRHAHKHLGISEATRLVVRPCDPYRPLERWCTAQLVDLSQESHADEPPAWWNEPGGAEKLMELVQGEDGLGEYTDDD